MFRGTTPRTLLALLGVALLAFQLFIPAGTFASAHTGGQALAKTETGTHLSALPAYDGADTVRTPDRPGRPASVPQVRDRHRGPASASAQERPLISGRTAGTAPHDPCGARHRHAPGASRAHTPAALQVFRC
ncbi:hypothetical protein D9753_07720 [Streptomyces dangxiongensis]|uniref:Uncharacterized protein n=1 Tax=Streptomyces dangxiongensis TaxID=1442032 RepID=A0A3G2JB28_9ACTN|nr:hypothetical protein [Streptomyces dangxiongensis]AYN38821.1 hypothetical protein D9753_07720 [Streptomyces dangxiongensis]